MSVIMTMVKEKFTTLVQGFEAMFLSLADFAEGKKWSFNDLKQDTLAKINFHLIKTKQMQSVFPAYYMSNANAPDTIIRLVRKMGWYNFNADSSFTFHT